MMFGAVVALLACAGVVVALVLCNRSGGQCPASGDGGGAGSTGDRSVGATASKGNTPTVEKLTPATPTVENTCKILTGIVASGGTSGIPKVGDAVENLLEFADGKALTETLQAGLKEVAQAILENRDYQSENIGDRELENCAENSWKCELKWNFWSTKKKVSDLIAELVDLSEPDKWDDLKWVNRHIVGLGQTIEMLLNAPVSNGSKKPTHMMTKFKNPADGIPKSSKPGKWAKAWTNTKKGIKKAAGGLIQPRRNRRGQPRNRRQPW